MQILRLSIANFKRNIRFYLSYILSLSFSAFILYDFLALMDSGLLEIMEKKNQEFSDMILVSMIVVLLFFVFCFLWYATNVFFEFAEEGNGDLYFHGTGPERNLPYVYAGNAVGCFECRIDR